VGKSTFIEALGSFLTKRGLRVAVLAVDPSSERTKGSILGDKTRMVNLSQDPLAFIRPSPSSGSLGGVGRKTRETMLLCEAAGFDVVLVETVGVGQSEIAVTHVADSVVLVVQPGSGDVLQFLKAGVMEIPDLLVVNKADLGPTATRAASDLKSALSTLRQVAAGESDQPVLLTSARDHQGIEALVDGLDGHRVALGHDGIAMRRRTGRAAWAHEWLLRRVGSLGVEALGGDAHVVGLLRDAIARGELALSAAYSLADVLAVTRRT
jgi:LAO/AO transport system kinase